MDKRIYLAAGLAVALAACGKSGGGAQSAAGGPAVQMQPGEWEMTVETVNLSGAGLPPAYAAQMKGHKITTRNCITPEEAAHPMAKMTQDRKNDQCNYSGFSFADGRIQGIISCGAGGGAGKTTMSMNGQYDGQNYAYTSRMTSEGRGMDMTIDSKATGHRVGDCPAGGKDDTK